MKIIKIILRVLLVVTTLIYPLFMDMMSAAGWQYNVNEGNYPQFFAAYATWMFIGAGLLIIGAVFTLCGAKPKLWRCNAIALGCAAAGITSCMTVLYKFTAYADRNFPAIDGTMQPVSELYLERILPTLLPFALLCVLAVWQMMSYDAKVYRQQKRDAKRRQDEEQAPKILSDE